VGIEYRHTDDADWMDEKGYNTSTQMTLIGWMNTDFLYCCAV